MKREFWNIIAKKLTNEPLDHSELGDLNQLMDDHDKQTAFNDSEYSLHKTQLYFKLKKIDTDEAWRSVMNEINNNNKVVSLRIRLLQAAAVILMLVVSGFGIWRLSESKKYEIIQTAHNETLQREIILPDGSKVSLNRRSKLIYPKQFKNNQRIVTLQGEAFFEVTPNSEMPFIINTGDTEVKVLGTSFNVKAYEGDDEVEVFVRTGMVELKEKESALAINNLTLLPGEKGIFNTQSRLITKKEMPSLNDISWLTHEIEFKNTLLKEVLKTLEDAYHIKCEVGQDVDLNVPISVSFSHQEPDYIMDVIALTHALHLTKIDKTVYRISK